MLAAINDRLELLVGRDHTIGHAFFMNLTSLDQLVSVFHNKVIPQLQEYFYGNWSTINLILGDSFVSLKEQNQNNIWPKSVSANKDDFEVREIWEITDLESWNAEAFQSIYANIAEEETE
jgi:5-methylcytosine-specific restriction protein B